MNSPDPFPDDPEARLRGSWTRNAEAWTRAVREGRIPSRRVGTDAAIVDAVLHRPPGRVLDVGCGEGWLARELAAHRWEAVGVDGSAPLVERAREMGDGDFRVLGYEEIADDPGRLGGPFAAVVCNFSLLGESLAPLLRALAGSLEPGGTLFIQTVHPWTACGDEAYRDGWRTEHFAAFGGEFAEPMPWYFRTLGSWIRLLDESGVEMTGCEEPLDPRSGRPLSLLLTGRSRG